MEIVIKEVANNIYHLIIEETDFCDLCGQSFLNFIKNHQVPTHSILILETPSRRCNIPCNQDFLTATENFKAIAYVVNEETATYNPWKHAMLVCNSNKKTGYFDSYNDAFNWSIEQD
jgi:hypothetical protein